MIATIQDETTEYLRNMSICPRNRNLFDVKSFRINSTKCGLFTAKRRFFTPIVF